MVATKTNFNAAVDLWVQQTEARMTAVFRSSVQEVSSVVTQNLSGGVVNVQTGFLRASQVASTEAMPSIKKGSGPIGKAKYAPNFGQIALTIAGAEIGQTVYLGWTAEYGPYLEYGTSKISPRGFVRLAAAQWQAIVRIQTVRAKNVALNGFARLTE